MDRAKVQREKRLRRSILGVLENSKATGPAIRGQRLVDVLEILPDFMDAIECEPQGKRSELVLGLLKDLVGLGLVKANDLRTHKNQTPGSIDFTSFEITAKGTSLLAESIPAEPLVEDERI